VADSLWQGLLTAPRAVARSPERAKGVAYKPRPWQAQGRATRKAVSKNCTLTKFRIVARPSNSSIRKGSQPLRREFPTRLTRRSRLPQKMGSCFGTTLQVSTRAGSERRAERTQRGVTLIAGALGVSFGDASILTARSSTAGDNLSLQFVRRGRCLAADFVRLLPQPPFVSVGCGPVGGDFQC